MQVAKDIPSKLVNGIIKSKEKGETAQNSIIDYISKTIKLLANPTRKKMFLDCLDFPKEFDKNPLTLYHLRMLEDYGIIGYTNKGYLATKFAKELWDSIDELSVIPNSALSIKILLSLESKPETFTELKKNLKVNEGSLFRASTFLVNNKLITKEVNYYKLTSLADISKLYSLASKYTELIKNASYDENFESIVIPKEEEVEILNLFRKEKNDITNKNLWRMEDLINDHIIITCSYSSRSSVDEINDYIIKAHNASTTSKLVKLLNTFEKNIVRFGYETKYIKSLQKLLNILHPHGWRIFNTMMIEDVNLPKKFIRKFRGPKFGGDGIRKLLDVHNRPLLQLSFLPEENLDIQDVKNLSKRLFIAGLDEMADNHSVMDDLRHFRSRVEEITEIIDKIKNDFGQKIYYFHISEDYEDRLDILKENDSKCIGITFSPFILGFQLTSSIINSYNYPTQFQLNLVPPLTRYAKRTISKEGELSPGFGININVILKLFVLLGGDEIPIESPFYNRYEGWETKIQCDILNYYFKELKKPIPLIFGGINPVNAPSFIKNYGSNINLKFTRLDLVDAEKSGFSLEKSISALKQAVKITCSEEKEITEDKYKDYIDSFKFYKKY